VLADAGSIPAISTNNKGQPFFGWPFLLVDLVLNLRRHGFKDLSGTNLNVRFLHGPNGFYMDVYGRATQEQLSR
jgi:hypothetical protein